MTPEARADLRAALAAAAESNNWRFRLAALRQMGQLDDPELAPILDKVSKESRDARDRRTAEAALASRKGARSPRNDAPAPRARDRPCGVLTHGANHKYTRSTVSCRDLPRTVKHPAVREHALFRRAVRT